ncbi:MAG: L-threonylcarbamoyladenylate synthase [Candidatus Latescibacteria bacterium]|jgi:tRNA threonylcarbamoyl adenosine modification protein (Sua5/YciO/YrdC/YwlC family)|nr:threonylcarbamoyl-AMP synthase [Gemmatimonadaceae bacterium]MDP6016787.1 L-threonylcarbamoyladenylate synthase [Candidatus Latescibacterota bacterium]MDP7448507.1 L-threonylcarbamoyladenylate synthase [Candidatus Latescibacterota bacterium]HJP31363.1 L-threonylcarbamoyladenylate synthase [Candidatus Latescibacterota bacterium]|tara:strand:+ start:176 stop:799 length:624 start_codon:yes stop_codon:yes gene_type:complete
MADVLHIDPEHLKMRPIRRAVETLRDGGVIIYPTDTVYGFGCDITSKSAVERIQRIKGRDSRKPMSFVCADLTDISNYAQVSNFAYRILRRLLPGAYTFVLPATKETPKLLRSRQKTVGIRIPDHTVSTGLVTQLGRPLLSTSANRSDQDTITDPFTLEEELGNEVDLILECGELPVLPSSVVSLIGDEIEILREGSGDLSLLRESV